MVIKGYSLHKSVRARVTRVDPQHLIHNEPPTDAQCVISCRRRVPPAHCAPQRQEVRSETASVAATEERNTVRGVDGRAITYLIAWQFVGLPAPIQRSDRACQIGGNHGSGRDVTVTALARRAPTSITTSPNASLLNWSYSLVFCGTASRVSLILNDGE